LLHVIDASDPKVLEKIEVVESILENIWAKQEKIYVFNKCDQISAIEMHELEENFSQLHPLLVSAYSWMWLYELKQEMIKRL
jgi:50S ribosomal subunit-associated GTPase HflX